jgi:hypothetical protein
VQLRHRHVQLGLLGVFQVQEFGLAFAQVHAGQAHVAADAVVDVHHRVADLQLRQVAHHRFDLRDGFLLLLADAAAGAGVQFGLGDEDQARAVGGQLEAGVQRRTPSASLASRRQSRRSLRPAPAQVVFVEVLLQRFAAAVGFGADQHAAAGLQQVGAQIGQRIVGRRLTAISGTGADSSEAPASFLRMAMRIRLGQHEELLVDRNSSSGARSGARGRP